MNVRQHRFEALVNAFHADLYRYATWLCRDRDLAADLVQETLLRAWKALDSLREEAAAKGWLITILRRELARHYERARPAGIELDKVSLADERPGPESDTELMMLRRHIGALDEEYREPLIMQVLLGFSVEEIVDVMDLKQATVLTRLFRARKKLVAALDGGQRQEVAG
ncbi:MAG TPA: sigma-70 family RNA polymerase sigma factor [Gammaproteobacteria bacterium]